MGEELSECVCSGDYAWGLGGRHEEGDLWILSVPKGVLRCMGICLSRERTGFFNSRTAVLGIVPYTDRFVMTVIDRGIGIMSAQAAPGLGQMKRKKSLSLRICLFIINKM